MQYQGTALLKNGKTVLLRNATEDDAEAVYNIFQQTHAETDFLLSYPEENSFDVTGEAEFLKNVFQQDNEAEILAYVDGRLAGTAGIHAVGSKFKVRHRAEFGISVLREFWGCGIGRALTEACIECAKRSGYLQLELDAVAENETALGLYRSVGFTEYGRNPLGFKSRFSGMQELVLMRLELNSK